MAWLQNKDGCVLDRRGLEGDLIGAISLALKLVEIAAAPIDGIGHVARAPIGISH